MEPRILILAGSGRTGQQAIRYALNKGYRVNVLVRNPDKITTSAEGLVIFKGTPTHVEDLARAMKGCCAVISLLSALSEQESFSLRRIIPPHTLQISIQNCIQLMKENDISRILALSSIGVGDSYRFMPWYMKLVIKLTNFKLVFADHNAQESLLTQSGLNWTIARPVALNENETRGKLVVSYIGTPKPFKMSRKQLAKFFIDNIDNDGYFHQMPILSEK